MVGGGGAGSPDVTAPRAMSTNEPPGSGGTGRTGTVTPDRPVPSVTPGQDAVPSVKPVDEPPAPAVKTAEETTTPTTEGTPDTPPAATPAPTTTPPESYWVRMADGRIVEFPAGQVPGSPGHGENVLFPDGSYGRVVGRGEAFPNVADVQAGVPKPATPNRDPALNWGDPTSKPTYGHSFEGHGQGPKVATALRGEAGGTGQPQGQWLDNEAAARLIDPHRQGMQWAKDIDIPAGVGQVIMPDGSIVPVTRARLVPSQSGGFKTAFPILP
jgi:hypothetical protein